MNAKTEDTLIELAVGAVVAYALYRWYENYQAGQQQALADASVSSPLTNVGAYGPVTSQGQTLDSVVAGYLAQQLQQQQTVNQAVLQQELNALTGGGSSTGGSSSSSSSVPANAAGYVQQLQAITNAYDQNPTANERNLLHPLAQSIRTQAAAAGAGQLVYNPTLQYAQLEVNGAFY